MESKIIQGDCLKIMQTFPAESIDCCLTSPPYWGLRDYGVGGQYGLEKTPEEYIEKMTAVFHEVKRVLKKEGTLWLNIGDTYGGSSQGYGANKPSKSGFQEIAGNAGRFTKSLPPMAKLMPKCLIMIPERLAWSLIRDGWILRNKIIWYKPNGMPSSARDRFTNKWEYVFMFSQSKKYYFDLDAVREPHKGASLERVKHPWNGHREPMSSYAGMSIENMCHPAGRNPGDHWEINTQSFPEAHFAVFPEKLCEKPIKAGCPKDGAVIDPFCGVGTACLVAKQLGRHYIGIDISGKFCEMARKRIGEWLF